MYNKENERLVMHPKCKGKNYKYLGRFQKDKFLREGHNTYAETVQVTPVMPTGDQLIEQAAIRNNMAKPDADPRPVDVPEGAVAPEQQDRSSTGRAAFQSRQGSYLGRLGK